MGYLRRVTRCRVMSDVCLAHTHTREQTHMHKTWLFLLFFLKMTLVNWKITWKLLQLTLLWNWNCKLDGILLGHLHFVFAHTHTHVHRMMHTRVCVHYELTTRHATVPPKKSNTLFKYFSSYNFLKLLWIQYSFRFL